MHRRFAIHLGHCFRDLGVAAAYALAAGILVALIASVDDHSLGLAWMLLDAGALPAGVLALICCEAACSTLNDRRLRHSLEHRTEKCVSAFRIIRCGSTR